MVGISERLAMIQHAFNRENIRKVAALSSGTMVAQVIGMLAAPVLTRLYAPSEFGAFAIYVNGVLLIATISSLRYETTIVLVKQHRTAVLLVLVSALIASILALGLWGLIMVFEDSIHVLAGLGDESHLLLALPVSLMLVALYKIASNWSVRHKDFTNLSLSKLWQSLPQMVGQISFGLLHFGAWGLVIGEIIGRFLGFLTLAYRSRAVFGVRVPMRLQRVWTLLVHYRHYPLYSTWSALINEAGSVAPVFFLATLYGAGTAGFFALVQRVFALPIDLVGQTAQTFYIAEVSAAIRSNQKTLQGLFLKTVFLLLVLAIIPIALLIWYGPELFDVVFGYEWYTAGAYAQIMAVAYGGRFIAGPISQTMYMLGRQRLMLFMEIARLMSIVGVFAVGYLLTLGVETVLSWYAAVLVSFQVWMLLATWKLVKL